MATQAQPETVENIVGFGVTQREHGRTRKPVYHATRVLLNGTVEVIDTPTFASWQAAKEGAQALVRETPDTEYMIADAIKAFQKRIAKEAAPEQA